MYYEAAAVVYAVQTRQQQMTLPLSSYLFSNRWYMT